MKYLISYLLLLATSNAFAESYTAKDIRDRLEINADIYQVENGRVVRGPMRTNTWRLSPEGAMSSSDWTSEFEENSYIGLNVKMDVTDDGVVKLSVAEYPKSSDQGKKLIGNPLDKKEFLLKDFEAVSWKVKNIKDRNFFVRFVPSLRQLSKFEDVVSLPVSGTRLNVADTAGFLWTSEGDLEGKYIGMTTHRGTIAISYLPFKGATEIGTAEGKEIRLNVKTNLVVTLRSETDFLPVGTRAKVYGVYNPKLKTGRVNSVHSFSSDKVDRIQQVLNGK
ncbi:MAG: hypothetical protein H7326_05440 [Bdellovibrionaceae bacterium]|nr:hypothetical protein [Pseudobdellovibrionaceae bacterium]